MNIKSSLLCRNRCKRLLLRKSILPYPLGYAMKVVIPNEKTVAKKKMVYAWSTDGWSHPFTVFLLSWLIQTEF